MNEELIPPVAATLIEELKHLSRGSPEDVLDKIRQCLSEAWHCFRGSDEASMADWKISRAENFRWEPPILVFDIERHGGTVMGSTRAEIQTWEINLETLTAENHIAGRRQVRPMDKRLDTEKLAKEVTSKIIKCEHVEHICWLSDKRVRVLVSKLIPLTHQKTTRDRRARFAVQLSSFLQQNGWKLVPGTSPHAYEKEPVTSNKD